MVLEQLEVFPTLILCLKHFCFNKLDDMLFLRYLENQNIMLND